MKSLTVQWLYLPLLTFLCLFSSCNNDNEPLQVDAPITYENLDEWLNEAMMANPNVPGMMALVDIPDQITWRGATGLSRYEGEVPMQTDHQFVTASITKTMTATIILQLMEEHKLDLDSPVATWLSPGLLDSLTYFQETAYGQNLTVGQLLNHTSGIFDYLNEGSVHLQGFTTEPDRQYALQERVSFALELGQAHARPGQGFYYSNTNYILLGMLIEAITKNDIAEVFQKRIFEPLGMSNSHLKPEASDLADLCHGYYQDFDITSFSTNFNFGNPAGGLVSTLDDLHIFIQHLAEGQLFSEPRTLALMKSFGETGYGYGLVSFLNGEPYGQVWGHDGADPGYYCFMVYLEKQKGILVFAGNRAEIEVEDTGYFLNKVIEALAQ